MVSKEDWGLKNGLRNSKQKSGFTTLFEFKVAGEVHAFETEFRRDERVMRFLTVSLDKHYLGLKEEELN
jgi:small subunit ribosomal protein S6